MRNRRYVIYEDIKSKELFIALNKSFLPEQFKALGIDYSQCHIENYINTIGFFDEHLMPHLIGTPLSFKRIVKDSIVEVFKELTK